MDLGQDAGILMITFVDYQENSSPSLTFPTRYFMKDVLLAVEAKSFTQVQILVP